MDNQEDELKQIIENAEVQEITEQEKYCLTKSFLETSLATEQLLENIDNYKIDRKTFRDINIIGEQCAISLEKALKELKALDRK